MPAGEEPAGGAKQEVLRELNFGARVAEDERDELADYFVETDQWNRVLAGQVDVVFGSKGAGKSAIFTSLMNRSDELSGRGIRLIAAEKPRGSTVFQGLVADPPASEQQFVAMWKLYLLSLLGSVIADEEMVGEDADTTRDALLREGLLTPSEAPLSSRFRMVWDWIKGLPSRVNSQGEVRLDPASNVTSFAFKISLDEPSAEERSAGYRSLDDLLSTADRAFSFNGRKVWVLFDRLDVAFAESRVLEANGIRALFKTYLDAGDLDSVRLKIFLRSDIWDEITAGGFREASHITRQMRIEWSNSSLLNLIVSRAVRITAATTYYETTAGRVIATTSAQRGFFDGMVPEKVDVGRNPLTFEWILGRAQDGTKQPAPREVIHLLNEARDAQLRALERGEPEPPGRELLSRAALREALAPVSKIRLEQTLYAEYPSEKAWVQAFEGQRTEHTLESLADMWEVELDVAQPRAQRLIDIGFLEPRTAKGAATYWVPFLYRPALEMRQGAAA